MRVSLLNSSAAAAIGRQSEDSGSGVIAQVPADLKILDRFPVNCTITAFDIRAYTTGASCKEK